ncbi:MAG: cytochrome c, partial [Nitrospirota bacterium]
MFNFNSRRIFYVLQSIFLLVFFTSESKASSVDRGKVIFEKCLPCHTIGGGKNVGPDLKGVTERREREWLINFILSPQKMIRSGDPIASSLVKEYGNILMPNPGLSKEEVVAVLSYIESQKVPVEQPAVRIEKSLRELGFLSGTYLKSFEDPRNNKHATIYEYVEMESRNLKEGRVNLYFAGWLAADLRNRSENKKYRDELTYLLLRYSPYKDSRFLLNIGRHYIFEGVASEQIDGISITKEIRPWNGFSIFSGMPVETRFDGRKGDYIYGGRLFQKIKEKAELGISYLREDNDESDYREESGLDFWLSPIKQINLQGHSFYNNMTGHWMEHSYSLHVFPVEKFTLSALFTHTNYDDAFSARTLNAFSPDFLGKNEKLTKIGVSTEYRTNSNLTAVLDFI